MLLPRSNSSAQTEISTLFGNIKSFAVLEMAGKSPFFPGFDAPASVEEEEFEAAVLQHPDEGRRGQHLEIFRLLQLPVQEPLSQLLLPRRHTKKFAGTQLQERLQAPEREHIERKEGV